MLVVRAAGQDPRKFGGRNLIDDILRHRRSDGSFDGYVSYTSFAIFALRRSGASPKTVARAARWIERHQNSDGGFNVGGRGASGIDDTATAVQALKLAGRTRRRAPRRDVPRPPADLERRLPADPRRGAQRAVDGLRRPGPRRRRRPRGGGQEGPGLPPLADRGQRSRALLTHRAPDARCGCRRRRSWRCIGGPSSPVRAHGRREALELLAAGVGEVEAGRRPRRGPPRRRARSTAARGSSGGWRG